MVASHADMTDTSESSVLVMCERMETLAAAYDELEVTTIHLDRQRAAFEEKNAQMRANLRGWQ